MTRHAIISDIHSNLEALNAVLAFAKNLNIDKHYSLGDVVGYGANPNECVELVRNFDALIVGNHTAAVLDEHSDYFEKARDCAAEAMSWTRRALDEKNMDFLRSFEYVHRIGDFVLSHGSPVCPEEIRYVKDWAFEKPHLVNVEPEFQYLQDEGAILLFYGHSHMPVMHLFYGKDEVRKELIKTHGAIDLKRKRPEYDESILFSRGLINVGSVGQPRDGNPRACFVVYDDNRKIIEYHRVEYDVNTASEKILMAGLSSHLADRLFTGD